MRFPREISILCACEESGTVRDAFRARGFDAWSVDLQPCRESPNAAFHIQGDALAAIRSRKWDLVIGFPPCTYLTVTGNKWFKPEFADRFPTRHQDREDGAAFFMEFTKCERFAIENPVGVMSTRWRKPDQVVHPYHFGDPHSKATCLWLQGVPKLKHTQVVEPEFVTYKSGNRCAKWYHETSHSRSKAERAKARSKFFPGMAKAMAKQWGDHLLLMP